MRKMKLADINLRLFDGAAAAAAEGGAEVGGGEAPKAEMRLPGSSRRGEKGETKVIYGIGEDAPDAAEGNPTAGEDGQGASKSGVTTTSNTLEDKRQAFEELISGEYKDLFTEKTQGIINRRFKDVKGMEASLAAQKPILDMLLQKHGIMDGDMAKLQAAIEEDDSYWENDAEKAGLTVEQFKAMKKLERENEELQIMQRRQQGEAAAQQKLQEWYAEAERVREIYPAFDFKAEATDRDFLGLLKAGLSVQQAYELRHMDEIKEGTARAAARSAGEAMKARIQSRAERPPENGTSSQGAVIVKNDVHSLTRQDRAEIVRRSQKGEKIIF